MILCLILYLRNQPHLPRLYTVFSTISNGLPIVIYHANYTMHQLLCLQIATMSLLLLVVLWVMKLTIMSTIQKKNHWTVLPLSGHRFGVLHMLDKKLTIFGGSDSKTHKPHCKVTAYISRTNTWHNYFPYMLNKRFMPGVMTYNDYVLIMGEKSGKGKIHDSIEVMNYHYVKQWKQISVRLPAPM